MDLEVATRAIDAERARGYRSLRRLAAEAVRSGLTQREVAVRMNRTQAEVNRLARTSADRSSDGGPRWWSTARTTREGVAAELRAGHETQAFRLVVQARDDLRTLEDLDDLDEWALSPLPFVDPRFETLLAALATREFAARGVEARGWMRPQPLSRPWYLNPLPSGRRRAELEGAPDLRALGILAAENDLMTA